MVRSDVKAVLLPKKEELPVKCGASGQLLGKLSSGDGRFGGWVRPTSGRVDDVWPLFPRSRARMSWNILRLARCSNSTFVSRNA